MMLKELTAAMDTERQENPKGPDADEVASNLMRAGRELVGRQVIHSDDHSQKTNWSLICRHRGYFEDLMGAFGYRLIVDGSSEYVMIIPDEAAMSGRRGTASKIETLILFALRILWEEGSRQGEQDYRGWVEIDTTILVDHLASFGATGTIRKSEMKGYLAGLKARGLLRVGDEDPEEEVFPISIAPAIQHIVGPGLARDVMSFLEAHEAGEDVLDYLGAQRAPNTEEVRSKPEREAGLFDDDWLDDTRGIPGEDMKPTEEDGEAGTGEENGDV
jgi:hypothetical protein